MLAYDGTLAARLAKRAKKGVVVGVQDGLGVDES
jgi:hypothetical protein